jgi:hypothetical protein
VTTCCCCSFSPVACNNITIRSTDLCTITAIVAVQTPFELVPCRRRRRHHRRCLCIVFISISLCPNEFRYASIGPSRWIESFRLIEIPTLTGATGTNCQNTLVRKGISKIVQLSSTGTNVLTPTGTIGSRLVPRPQLYCSIPSDRYVKVSHVCS